MSHHTEQQGEISSLREKLEEETEELREELWMSLKDYDKLVRTVIDEVKKKGGK